jgi:hypothetical protein
MPADDNTSRESHRGYVLKLKPSSIVVSVLRAFAILIVLIGGSAFLQCASTPTQKQSFVDKNRG